MEHECLPDCPICNNNRGVYVLGALGALVWMRCQNCGCEFSIRADLLEPVETDDD